LISPKTTIPNHLDISKRIGIETSKSFGFFKITASLEFNFKVELQTSFQFNFQIKKRKCPKNINKKKEI
jgi:hypothetical protein